MRRRPRAVLMLPFVVLLLAVPALWAAGPAAAGGPTSVLLSVPGEGRLAALYYTDADYRALSDLVGLGDPSGPTDSERPHETGQVVTLTWLIHDVQVWRVDEVHLVAGAGPWVLTRQVVDETSVWEAPGVWHRAGNGLTALLTHVLPRPGSTTADDASAVDVMPPRVAADATPPRVAADELAPATGALPGATEAAAEDPGPPLGWTAAGVLAGSVLGVLLVHLRQRRRPASADDAAGTAEQLAWP